jgi:DNA-binding response OmpR family regulator
MTRQPNRVFSRAELLDACLPEGEALERTVDSHVSKLRRKLEAAGMAGEVDVSEFRRYGSARQLYHFHVDNAGAY